MRCRPFYRFAWLLCILVISGTPPVFGDPDRMLPAEGRILSGSGRMFREGTTLTVVQESGALILEWESLDIGPGARVVFLQPPGSKGVLNRVRRPGSIRISGDIQADGKIVLVHPAGVEFTESSRVTAEHLTVSTQDIRDADFLSGQTGLEEAWEISSAVNHGRISHSGIILADGGTVELRSGPYGEIENIGIIRARTTESGSGRILLISDLSSGRVMVGGTLDASAPEGGSGGFIETSAADVDILPDADITTRAENGACGQWLLDPRDFIIHPEKGSMTGEQVSQALKNSHFEIQSIWGSVVGKGDIIVNDYINWAENTLTLSAHRNIVINRELYGSGTAALTLKYGQGSTDGTIDGTDAEYIVNAPVNLPKGQNFRTQKGASGTEKGFMVITELGQEGSKTGQDLQGMIIDMKQNYALGQNIDACITESWNDGAGFEPIGGNSSELNLSDAPFFSACFDGLRHSINGLYINRNTNANGLFGYAKDSDIRNVQLINGRVSGGYSYTGSLVGFLNDNSRLTRCGTTNAVFGNVAAGGLAGLSLGKNHLSHCYNEGPVSGTNGVGGIIGVSFETDIFHSFNLAPINGKDMVGGIVGDMREHTSLTDCYHAGKITGDIHRGGLVGQKDDTGEILGSFWDTEVSEVQSSAGGGTGLTTQQMKEYDTYYQAGWDITTDPNSSCDWRIYPDKTYPLLNTYLTPITLMFPGKRAYDGTSIVDSAAFTWRYPPGHTLDPSRIYCDKIQITGKNVGIYSIFTKDFYSDQQGYDIRSPNPIVTFSIDPAPLSIIANDHIKPYDGIPYNGGNGVNGDGFVNNETLDVLSGTLSYGGTSQGATQPGTYTIIPAGLTSRNYSITFQAGVLIIGPSTWFSIHTYASPVEGGTVSGGGSFTYGSTVTVSALPHPGYNFVHWTENGSPVSTDLSYTFTITENHSLTAVFSPQKYTVTLFADPAQGGTVSGGGSFTYGSLVTLSAIPNPGYNFIHWTENGSPASTSASYSFAITSARTLTGHFNMIPPSKPVIDRLSPSETTAGGKPFALNVFGKYFDVSSQVCWNGSERPTAVISAGILTADITEIDILDPGTASITVLNRSPDNQEICSDSFPFEIRPNIQPTVETIPSLGEWGAILLVFGSLLTAVRCLKSNL